jgi:hypothetical protein
MTGNSRITYFLFILFVGLLAVSINGVFNAVLSQSTIDKGQNFIGVCPPFFIRDANGVIINPAQNQNANKPYSPKQTCGLAGCHNYEKITKGYHFQQGKDEEASEEMKSLYHWVLSPGQ